MKRSIAALALGIAFGSPLQAADQIRVGFLSTLSGPGAA